MKTKAYLETENATLAKENNVLALALSDLANLGAKSFGHSRQFSILITRPKSACGGIAIVKRNGSVSAHYFEEFAQTELAHIAAIITGANTDYNRELLNVRAAIEDAKAYISEQQKAA